MSTNKYVLARLFEYRAITVREVFDLVSKNLITKKDFHWVTSLDYDMIKKEKGW